MALALALDANRKIVKLYVFGHQNAARLIIGRVGLQSVWQLGSWRETRWQHFNCSARKCRLHLNFEASRGRCFLGHVGLISNQQPVSSWAAVGQQLSRPQAFISLSLSLSRGRFRCRFY